MLCCSQYVEQAIKNNSLVRIHSSSVKRDCYDNYFVFPLLQSAIVMSPKGLVSLKRGKEQQKFGLYFPVRLTA